MDNRSNGNYNDYRAQLMQEIFYLTEDDSLLDEISKGEREESVSNSIEKLDGNMNNNLNENLAAHLEEDENNDFEAHDNFNIEKGLLPGMSFANIDSLVQAYQEHARVA
ncbi:conserved hypothetical protein [Ricinus communis]|uniref:Uncharacterized protein n=1 Tax=Ricinus communis TaxID=3988 RepID=B9RBI7_RICCO|nr:conserved hypothetical protein [Ricinus communis]